MAERYKRVLDDIYRKWPSGHFAIFCERIVRFIVDSSEQESSMLTYADLARLAKAGQNDPEIMISVSILSSRYSALVPHFVILIEGEDPHYMDDEECAQFLADGTAVDPQTGSLISTSEDVVYPYFAGNRQFLLQDAS